MRSGSFVVAVLLLHGACGGTSKPTQTASQPAETKAVETTPPTALVEPAESASPVESAAPAEPASPAEPEQPTRLVELSAPAFDSQVKLVFEGKGKLEPLRYSATLGGPQQVEVVMDLTTKKKGGRWSEQVFPTIVLTGEAKAVQKGGQAEYAFTVAEIDSSYVRGSPSSAGRNMTLGLTGLVISGTVGPTGVVGDTKLRGEQSYPQTGFALEVIHSNLPSWPVLPDLPVGIGAKWRATTSWQWAGAAVTQVTDYEVISKKGATWKIRGKTKISGGITGTGTTQATVTDGALYPSFKTTTEIQDAEMVAKMGWVVTVK